MRIIQRQLQLLERGSAMLMGMGLGYLALSMLGDWGAVTATGLIILAAGLRIAVAESVRRHTT